jgi:hypothetical protein
MKCMPYQHPRYPTWTCVYSSILRVATQLTSVALGNASVNLREKSISGETEGAVLPYLDSDWRYAAHFARPGHACCVWQRKRECHHYDIRPAEHSTHMKALQAC